MRTVTEVSAARVAHLLRYSPDQIDLDRLRRAQNAVTRETRDYWDALANSNQLHGNIPLSVAVAITYDFLEQVYVAFEAARVIRSGGLL